MQRQADHEKLELAIRRIDAEKKRELEERARLEEELQKAIDGNAVLCGNIEGYQEHLVDMKKAHDAALSNLEPMQSLGEGLLGQLQEAQATLERMHQAESSISQKASRLEA